jgi:hypothetical protein
VNFYFLREINNNIFTVSEEDSQSRSMHWSFVRFRLVSGPSEALQKALSISSLEGILKLFSA